MILDNLGLTIKIGDVNDKYAKSLGKTVEALTISEKKQAMLNAVLESGGKIMERVGEVGQQITDAERWQMLNAAVADLRAEVGKRLLGVFIGVAEKATEFVKRLKEVQQIKNLFAEVAKGTASISEELMVVNAEIAELTGRKGLVKGYEEATRGIQNQIAALEARRAALAEQIKWEAIAKDATTKRAKEEAEAAARSAGAEAARAKQLQEYLAAVNTAYGATEAGQREALETAIAYWEDQLPYAVETKDEVIAILADLRGQLGGASDAYRVLMEARGGYTLGLEEEGEKIGEIKTSYEELGETLTTLANETFQGLSEAMGASMVNAETGLKKFKEVIKSAISAALTALGTLMMVPPPSIYFNPFGAAMAFAGAGAVKALKYGGVINEPIHGIGQNTGQRYLMGEAGPERITPMSGGGGQVVIHNHVQGSILTEEQIYNASMKYAGRMNRGY